MESIRINKYLVEAGVCSRREADRLIQAGKVLVNTTPASLGQKVDGSERIVVRGKIIAHTKKKSVYLAYHKPVGIICTSDPSARDNIITAVHYPERVFHIGRLDVASSGLILLTNDGEIVNTILRSEGQHEKEYVVKVDEPITTEFLRSLATGVEVLGRKTLPARVKKIGKNTFSIILIEGRNRQIRRMCEALGLNVVSLKRIRIMNIHLDDLPVGTWRHLTKKEEVGFFALLKK
ncbi:MAG: pseudouridine synthase [Candidatus Kerfeldbacteria bacterium]|nr:pseudouridine synthase [Candidatus Kerfeldbacteria bacterium]